MSVPTIRTPRSPFIRSARSNAAVPGAPEAVTRTVMSRIGRAMLLGEEERDAVPAVDLTAVPPVERAADPAAAEPPADERLLRAAVDLRARSLRRRGCERAPERGQPGARRLTAGKRCAHRRARERKR